MEIDGSNSSWTDLGVTLHPTNGFDITAEGTIFWEAGSSEGPVGDPGNIAPGTYAAPGLNRFCLAVLFRSASDGAPPPAPDSEGAGNPGGVSQVANVFAPGLAASLTSAQIAAIAPGLAYPAKAFAIFNDDKYEDNTGFFTVTAAATGPNCGPFPQPIQAAVGEIVNNSPAILIRVNPA